MRFRNSEGALGVPEKPVGQLPCPTQSLIQWLTYAIASATFPRGLQRSEGRSTALSSRLKPLVPFPLEMVGGGRLVSEPGLSRRDLAVSCLHTRAGERKNTEFIHKMAPLQPYCTPGCLLGWVPFPFTPAPGCLQPSEALEAMVGIQEKGRF